MKAIYRIGIILTILSILLTALPAEIGEPVQINLEDGKAHFAGQNGIRRAGDIIHLAYLEQDEENFSVIYARTTESLQNIDYLIIDQYDSKVQLGEPTLEVLSDGTVYVLYPSIDNEIGDFTSSLFLAEIDENGNLIETSTVSSNTYNRTAVDIFEENLMLLSANGYRSESFDNHLYYDKYIGLDDTPGSIRFFGADIVNGPVHSNTDIWIRQIGGGPNEGWPLFEDIVTTSGVIRVFPGGGTDYPEEQIFQGGLIEQYPELKNNLSADLIRANGLRPFGNIEHDDRIAFVTIDGSHFESWIGFIVEEETIQYPVYDSYPPYGPIGNQIATNDVTVIDTVWTIGPTGMINNQSVWVPYELWISGNVAGKQTWGSSHSIYIKDDLTYTNTIPGNPPDGGDPDQPGFPQYPINNTDCLGLISEKSIYVQYGYRHPEDSLRYKPNTDDVFIYGYLVAGGSDDEDPVDAGIFSFQYQHPKGSTPAQEWEGEFYSNIDLHLRHYPTTPDNPWPPGLDYPWYNPLWPEPGLTFAPGAPYTPEIPNPHEAPTITYLRGDVRLFGGFASRRVGFIRRSGTQDYDTGIWDLENYLFGRHSDNPTGYNKDYYHDKRLPDLSPPDIHGGDFLDAIQEPPMFQCLKQDGDVFLTVFENYGYDYFSNLHLKVYEHRIAIIAGNTISLSDDTGNNFQIVDLPSDNLFIIDMLHLDDGLYILVENHPDSSDKAIVKYSITEDQFLLFAERNLPNRQQALTFDGESIIWAADESDQILSINFYNLDGYLMDEYVWMHEIPEPDNFSSRRSKLGISKIGDLVTLAVYNREEGSFFKGGDLYLAEGTLDDQSIDIPETISELTLSHFPNPVRLRRERGAEKVNIRFSLQSPSSVKIDLFNIKGQLIKNINEARYPQGKHEISWDGKDNRGNTVGRGVYFYRIETDNDTKVNKMLILE